MRRIALLVWIVGFASAGSVRCQFTQRVSVSSSGGYGDGESGLPPDLPRVSADGRYVVFKSNAYNLVANDTNNTTDIFVRDRLTGTTERASVRPNGGQANGESSFGFITPDGRYVSFTSKASNLGGGQTQPFDDVFVRDRQAHTTICVSVDPSGNDADGASKNAWMSADGRFVVFDSLATNLVPGDVNGFQDIFVRDLLTNTTERVSVDSSGAEADGDSSGSSISDDGRIVVFVSSATNLVPGDTNGAQDVFAHDRLTGTTARVNVNMAAGQTSGATEASVSSDGRFVVFECGASDLVPGDTNAAEDVFVRDLQAGTTERVSVSSAGAQGNGDSRHPSISPDGRFVVFWTVASNLGPGDTNNESDIYIRDRELGTTERVSVNSRGGQKLGGLGGASVASGGRFVVFSSSATTLAWGALGYWDVYVRDRTGGPAFTVLCEPGVDGVALCPCSNAPSGPGQGCDNSAGTGGAALTAQGGSFLSSDSLYFTTSGEKPTATSVLLQGTSSPAAGVVYGQGVRCVGGTLKRLFTKTASSGSITAPGTNDPPISLRSAAVGNPISAGASRWYLVFYRDPIVLGGCPSTSTFNSTSTGRIVWSP